LGGIKLNEDISFERSQRYCSDFNSEPDTLVHKLIIQHGQMTDAWQSQHPSTPGSISTASINQQVGPTGFDANAEITQKGITCNSPINTWSKRTMKQAVRDRNAG
ncbi:913_t:CDS:2, partial [Acaulospora colombiana]